MNMGNFISDMSGWQNADGIGQFILPFYAIFKSIDQRLSKSLLRAMIPTIKSSAAVRLPDLLHRNIRGICFSRLLPLPLNLNDNKAGFIFYWGLSLTTFLAKLKNAPAGVNGRSISWKYIALWLKY
jgi:hypothetical protein